MKRMCQAAVAALAALVVAVPATAAHAAPAPTVSRHTTTSAVAWPTADGRVANAKHVAVITTHKAHRHHGTLVWYRDPKTHKVQQVVGIYSPAGVTNCYRCGHIAVRHGVARLVLPKGVRFERGSRIYQYDHGKQMRLHWLGQPRSVHDTVNGDPAVLYVATAELSVPDRYAFPKG
ncbi:MAG TPA: hypothetical protein VFH39_00370 [Candidatus Saccharimonadales bacterium]|nr:hypothetical protein [Candidatus Saccharimonadales bacterium]